VFSEPCRGARVIVQHGAVETQADVRADAFKNLPGVEN
jgi:hypothetical protein